MHRVIDITDKGTVLINPDAAYHLRKFKHLLTITLAPDYSCRATQIDFEANLKTGGKLRRFVEKILDRPLTAEELDGYNIEQLKGRYIDLKEGEF